MEKEKKKLKTWHWILLGIGIFLFLVAIFGGSDSSDSDNSKINTNSNSGNLNANKDYNLNEGIVVNNFQYVFTNPQIQSSVGDSYSGKDADGSFLILNLKVTNLGNEADYINNEIYFIDEQGREFSQDDDAWVYLENNFIFEELNPSLTKSGQIIFDIPKNLNGKLCIKENLYSSNCKAYVSW